MITIVLFLTLVTVIPILSWHLCTARSVLFQISANNDRAVAVNDAADMATDGAE